ncbi:MAG: lysophospholipid acyltransferase family protein [Candidatus Nanopelagicales bacterium]
MASRRHGAKQLGPYFRFAVLVLEPFLTVWTRRERRNIEILKADYPPNDGIVVVVNHMSWFDPMNVCHVLWDAGRPPRFLAKDRLFDLPGIGQVLDGAGQIPVYRDSDDPASAIRSAIEAVNNGECIVIYPEGTMTRDPDYWPMKGRSGAAQLGLITGAPVIPMAQWGPQEVIRPYETEFNLFPRKTMQTLVGEPVDLDDLRGKELTAEVLHEATDRIMAAITTLLEELRGEQAPAEPLDFREWKAAHESGQPVVRKMAAKPKPPVAEKPVKKAATKKAATKKTATKKAVSKRTTSASSTKKGDNG